MVHIKNIVENRLAQNRLAGMAYMFNKVSQTLINFGEIYTNTTEAESSFDVCIKILVCTHLYINYLSSTLRI